MVVFFSFSQNFILIIVVLLGLIFLPQLFLAFFFIQVLQVLLALFPEIFLVANDLVAVAVDAVEDLELLEFGEYFLPEPLSGGNGVVADVEANEPLDFLERADLVPLLDLVVREFEDLEAFEALELGEAADELVVGQFEA